MYCEIMVEMKSVLYTDAIGQNFSGHSFANLHTAALHYNFVHIMFAHTSQHIAMESSEALLSLQQVER